MIGGYNDMIGNCEMNTCCEVLITMDTGEKMKVENVKRIDISEDVRIYDWDVDNYKQSAILKGYLLDIEVDHTTKKRFIKLLMSKGIQRNCAIEIARYFLNKYGFYSQEFLLLF